MDNPAWLASQLDDAVARLSGARDLAPGVRLANRAKVANRDAVCDWLTGELQALGWKPEINEYGTGANVFTRIPPTTASTDWVVLGAHFDSVTQSPGANDNATGVAVSLAVARQLRDLPCRRRGVIIAFFDEEEVGLVGSMGFATMLFRTDTSVTAVHTIDQAGWDQDGDRVFEIERPTDALFAEYEAAAASVGAAVRRTTTGSTDHVSFRKLGYDAAGVTEEYKGGDTTPYYHQAGDRYNTVKIAYTALAARLVTAVLVEEVDAGAAP